MTCDHGMVGECWSCDKRRMWDLIGDIQRKHDAVEKERNKYHEALKRIAQLVAESDHGL